MKILNSTLKRKINQGRGGDRKGLVKVRLFSQLSRKKHLVSRKRPLPCHQLSSAQENLFLLPLEKEKKSPPSTRLSQSSTSPRSSQRPCSYRLLFQNRKFQCLTRNRVRIFSLFFLYMNNLCLYIFRAFTLGPERNQPLDFR